VLLQQVGSYLEYTGHGANAFWKAARDPGCVKHKIPKRDENDIFVFDHEIEWAPKPTLRRCCRRRVRPRK
jgi:hypothetical protein